MACRGRGGVVPSCNASCTNKDALEATGGQVDWRWRLCAVARVASGRRTRQLGDEHYRQQGEVLRGHLTLGAETGLVGRYLIS
jgi:hypothetical protein